MLHVTFWTFYIKKYETRLTKSKFLSNWKSQYWLSNFLHCTFSGSYIFHGTLFIVADQSIFNRKITTQTTVGVRQQYYNLQRKKSRTHTSQQFFFLSHVLPWIISFVTEGLSYTNAAQRDPEKQGAHPWPTEFYRDPGWYAPNLQLKKRSTEVAVHPEQELTWILFTGRLGSNPGSAIANLDLFTSNVVPWACFLHIQTGL